jgi:hypothetical protein
MTGRMAMRRSITMRRRGTKGVAAAAPAATVMAAAATSLRPLVARRKTMRTRRRVMWPKAMLTRSRPLRQLAAQSA